MKTRHNGEKDTSPKRVENDGGTLADLSRRLREKSPNGHRIELFDDTILSENFHLVHAYYDQTVPGDTTSDRAFLGPLFRFAKRAIRKLVGWYIRPALDSQRLFNAYVARTINEMTRYLDHLQINEDILSTIMHRDLALFRANILYQNRFLEQRALLGGAGAGARIGEGPAEAAGGGNGKGGDLLDNLDVLTLEQRVHGSPRMVLERQKVYLPYLRGCSNVLAIGCGRGEILQLMAQEKITARGTESNPALVEYCRDQGLDVSLTGPFECMESQEDASLDGLFLSRFAGHQPPACLIRMLNLCRQKLSDNGVLIIETPNPFSLYAVASYALDDSDLMHPLHPETLKLLCLSYDFIDPQVMFLNPLPPEEHLEELPMSSTAVVLDPREQELFHHINKNFERINFLLFSHRDYALVTRRSPRDAY